MVRTARPARLVTAVGAASLVAALAACSSSGGGSDATTPAGSSTTSSGAGTTSSAPDPTSSTTTTDYSSLLIDASDIPIDGFEKGTPQAPPQGTGTTVAFTGANGRTLGDTILVLGSAADAQSAASSSADAAKAGITDAEVTAAPIGDGGTAIRGTSASGAVAVLVFSEGTAVVVLEFDSAAGDLVPTDVIQAVATAQDSKVSSGLS